MPDINNPEALDLHVHVPKTGTTSLAAVILERYGVENVWAYKSVPRTFYRSDKQPPEPGNTIGPLWRRLSSKLPSPVMKAVIAGVRLRATPQEEAFKNARAIMGHFSVNQFDYEKLAGDRDVKTFTVVRDPLSRMVSHYRFIQRYRGTNDMILSWRSGQDPDLPFAKFAMGDNMQNFQSSFTGTDPERFDHIGTTEDMTGFMRSVGLIEPLAEAPDLHPNPSKPLYDPVIQDTGFIRDFEAFHEADYRFYVAASERAQHES